MMPLIFTVLFGVFTLFPLELNAQLVGGTTDIFSAEDDDLNIGGDIFTDFSEDIEDAKVTEDERFYRFGRFVSFNMSLGLTTFDGNRGTAYENSPPTLGLGFTFFKDFQTALNLGFAYSKHSMFLPSQVTGFTDPIPGNVDVAMLRVFLGYRYYIDTANLGTAITYSNPYFIGRLEYWYTTNKYPDMEDVPSDTGGGLGTGLGFGLEFPVEIKESYIGLEFLFHVVNFYDKNTLKYSPVEGSDFGYEDLRGNAYSTMLSYIWNW
jgi:hypothetical protein